MYTPKQQKLLRILEDYGVVHWEQTGAYGRVETAMELTLRDLEDIISDCVIASDIDFAVAATLPGGSTPKLPEVEFCYPDRPVPAASSAAVGEDLGTLSLTKDTQKQSASPDGVTAEIAALEARLQRFDEELLDQQAAFEIGEDLGVSDMARNIWEADYGNNERRLTRMAGSRDNLAADYNVGE